MKENLFYLPPYEDEATAEKIREIYGYPIRYMKQYLLDFFTALYEEQHHIYVLLENLPLDYFAVERTYDRLLYWNNFWRKNAPSTVSTNSNSLLWGRVLQTAKRNYPRKSSSNSST